MTGPTRAGSAARGRRDSELAAADGDTTIHGARQAVPVHWLRPNHRVWSPPQLITFTCATRARVTPDGEEHTLQAWSAQLDVRRARRAAQVGTVANWGMTGQQLAAQITAWTAGQTVMWLYGHGLAVDLTVTDLISHLQHQGWVTSDHAVASDTPWLRLKRGRCVLTLADSWGWLRAPLNQIAPDVGMSPLPAPDAGGGIDAARARASAENAILSAAMLQLMQWWDDCELGTWALTSSAAGWNAMRHRLPDRAILVVTDPAQVADDRRAVYGGRRQAMRAGQMTGGPYHLADFHRAYTVIARELPLPVRRRGNFTRLDADSPLICGQQYGVIAECELDTPSPRWPVRAGNRVAWPTGRFTTVLAGPEIAEARRLGCLRGIGAGWLHSLGTPLAPWAQWCLAQQSDPDDLVPPVAKRALKHWGRAVIGKTAAHGWDKHDIGGDGGPSWHYEPIWDAGTQMPGHLVAIGGKTTQVVQTSAADNAYPAILAFVESWVRVFLGRLIDAIGEDHVISCDTDGLIIAASVPWQDRAAAADTGPLTLRHKASWQELTLWGPQHYQSESQRVLAGIPRSARPAGDGLLEAVLWPKLPWQMTRQRSDAYLRPVQRYSVAESYCGGWVTTDGTVVPLHALICPCGQTVLAPWQHTPAAATGLQLAQVQAVHLQAMITIPEIGASPCIYHSSRSAGTDIESPHSPQMTSLPSLRNLAARAATRAGSWLMPGRRTVTAAPQG